MLQDKIQSGTLTRTLEAACAEMLSLLEDFTEEELNRQPWPSGWSAAQVADHVTKSNLSIGRALQLAGTPINRPPDERVEELKAVFLDFDNRLKSPDFILPGNGPFEKDPLIRQLEESGTRLRGMASSLDLSTMINSPAFGDITKYEIVHFVLYHTQRHLNQLRKIIQVIRAR